MPWLTYLIKNRPIIFVGHSLGGLVIKAALIKSAEYHSHDRFPGLAEIYKNTLGVVFIGTPHSGSGKETYGEVLQTLATLSFRKPNKQLLRTLKTDSGVLDSQRNDFTTISRNMSIFCVREELPTAIGMVSLLSRISHACCTHKRKERKKENTNLTLTCRLCQFDRLLTRASTSAILQFARIIWIW